MKKSTVRSNRRKGNAGRRPLASLLLVLILLGGILLFLHWLKGRMPAEKAATPGVERQLLPPRHDYGHLEQQTYTSLSRELPTRQRRPRRAHGPGTVAIIVDDMGSSIQEVRSLMAINVPMTFSLIPGLPKVREVADTAQSRGYQVMIHMPMEPQGYPQQRMEGNGLLISASDEVIVRRINDYFKAVPGAVGANNHMGSRFTEDGGKMRTVLNQLKARSLFFVDSRTSPHSVGLSLANELQIEAAGRNVFLDNVQEQGAINAQLDQLAKLARKRGSAIGICHPHKATILALAAALPRLENEGIKFVPVSELVR